MKLIAFTDGAARGNPGESGIGVVLQSPEGTVVKTLNGYLGMATNNVAEYTALIACLQAAVKLQCTELTVFADSELMVRQVNGQYKVKDATLKVLHKKVIELAAQSRLKFSIAHIERSKNSEADRLANEAIDHKTPLEGFPAGRFAQQDLFH